jgi:ABC-type Fe3+/spermidine/putrescine transport system ATPase subunit
LNAVRHAYEEYRWFRRSVHNQTYRNLQPILNRIGIKKNSHPQVTRLSGYLLMEIALKLYFANQGLASLEYAPRAEMQLMDAIYSDKRSPLKEYASKRLELAVVDPDHTSALELRNVSFRYPTRSFELEGVNLKVPLGTQFCLVGPNGCGKTTILRLIGGHLAPRHGQILYREEEISFVPAARRPFATVFQDHALFPHLSVLDNVAYGLQHRNHLKRSEAREMANEWIDRLGISQFRSRRPPTLSLGSQQRVAIARALAIRPEMLLMDEPSASLDTPQKRELILLLAQAHDKGWVDTIVLVSHDLEFALSLCDQVAILDSGMVLASGDIQKLYTQPPDAVVARYLDSSNILLGDVDTNGNFRTTDGAIEFSITGKDQRPVGRTALLVRPDGIVFSAHSQSTEVAGGTVELVLRKFPPELLVRVGERIVIRGRVNGTNGIERGTPVNLDIDPTMVMCVPVNNRDQHNNKKGMDQPI